MATQLQELQAKRKELQATNPNASMLDARNALTPAISNAPVAWQPPVTPPITPSPSVHDTAQLGTVWTEETNRAQFEANKEKRQQMIASGAIPAVWEQATPAQVPQIVQQAEAQKVTPSVTTETPTATPTTPPPTTPPPNTEKKAEIVTPERPATVWDMFNNIVNRIDVTPEQKALPSYKIAQNRYTKASMYASMTPAQLAQDVKDAKIVEWSPAWEDIKMLNPKLVRDTQNLNTVNGTTPTIFTYVNNPDGTRTKENKLVSSFVSDYEDNYGDIVAVLKWIYGGNTAQEARDAIYTPDVRQAEAKATEIELQMNAIDDQIQAIDADVEKEFEWSWATGSRIALEKASRKEKLGNQYNSLLKSYTAYANNANKLITQNTDLYNIQREQRKEMQNALAWLAMTQYQSQLWLATKQAEMQMEADFAKRQAYENINDPATAIANMMAMYQQKGIPFTQSLQTKLSEFANSWLTLGQYLDQMTKDIQAKPEYKALTATKPTTTAEWKVIWKNADGSDRYGFVDATKGTITPYIPWQWASGDLRWLANQFPWQAWAKNNNPAGITWNANFDNGTGTAKLLQDAGIAYSKWTPRPAWEGGNYVTFNTIEDWLKAQQIIMTQTYWNKSVWEMLSSWVWTVEWPNYAQQVAWMAGIADLNQKVSSLTPDQIGKLQMAKIQKESPWLYGLLSQPAQATPVSQYTDQNVSDLAYLVELQEKNPTQASKEMKELWYTSRDLANYKGWNVPLTDRQKQSSINLANSIKDLLTNYDYTDATGFHFFDEAPRGSDWASAEEKIKTIVANMTLPNLGMLKWPMSDKDLAFIQAASSNLSTNQSDATFWKQLLEAYKLAARRAWLPEAKTLNDIKNETKAVTATWAWQTVSGNKWTYTW